ncbi:hypothetical protein [Saccharospirillum sp.]|uniref:hypothetical protein n=1 Tax=Saccharospirillum sp. TaxID=2033801 RepID=UPI00329A56DC
MQEIPLFNQYEGYVTHIEEQLESFGYSKYHKKGLVNFYCKFDAEFYNLCKALFVDNPDDFINGNSIQSLLISKDFLDRKVGNKLLFRTIAKFFLHSLFRLFGKLKLSNKNYSPIVRRGYVEDTESLFDNNDVLRLIYPFPISASRQIKYIRYLARNKKKYTISGFGYVPKDIFKFIKDRNYYSLYRLENRAAIRHGLELKKTNIKLVQCSDEYDIGSYWFYKVLGRAEIKSVNSAHGISKYLPYQSYTEFHVLTSTQKQFYSKFNVGLTLSIRKLTSNNKIKYVSRNELVVVFLSQANPSSPRIVHADEQKILDIYKVIARKYKNVTFYIKWHPNSSNFNAHIGPVKSCSDVLYGSERNLIQFSLYSTCQVDPSFGGHKFLVETKYIKPSFVFTNDQLIVGFTELSEYICMQLDERLGVCDG